MPISPIDPSNPLLAATTRFVRGLTGDLRFAVRLLVKDRWMMAVAALALALGIGMNAAGFTLVNTFLIRGLPFEDPDRLMYLGERDAVSGRNVGVSLLDFHDWRQSQKTFIDLAAWSPGTMNVSDEGLPPERYNGVYISTSAFRLFGARPIHGRDFVPDDELIGAGPVVLLGYSLWKSRYNADPSMVGRVIRVNEVPAAVVGIMAEGMNFPDADLWVPLSHASGLATQSRNQRMSLQAFGRLAPGVPREQAQNELTAIATRLEQAFPETNRNIGVRVITFNERLYSGPVQLVLLATMGAVGFVLLIACANVANLLLARATDRAKEIAVRLAIGATRWRIIRQLLIESLLLAVIGGTLGLFLAIAGTRWFDAATQDAGRPYYLQFTMDGTVFVFFAAVCLATGIVFGLAPALHISKTRIVEVIKEGASGGGQRARRWTSALVVVELTLTLVLLAGAGFMMRSFLTMYRLDVGIETAHLLTMNLSLADRKYPGPDGRAEFYRRLDERLGVLGSIRSGAITSVIPFAGGPAMRMTIDGRPDSGGSPAPEVTQVFIGPRYFETLGLTLIRGRDFVDVDGTGGQQIGIVNQRLASMFFANEDPIGQRIRLLSDPAGAAPAWITIVGVSPTVRQRNIREPESDPVIYLPYRSSAPTAMSLLIRTSGQPSAMVRTLREEVRALDPDLPLFGFATMDEKLAQARLPYRLFSTMFSVFAGMGLLLSAVGLYAVTAFSVAQRRREIGIRMALGAEVQQVCWLILRRSFAELVIGLTLGMAGAIGVRRVLRSLLIPAGANDSLTLIAIAAVYVMVSVAGCYWPARRAARIDPIRALHSE